MIEQSIGVIQKYGVHELNRLRAVKCVNYVFKRNNSNHLPTLSFDLGAIESNYIDEQSGNDNVVHLQQFIEPLSHSVKLSDNKTQ
jgi:hypothetical protein